MFSNVFKMFSCNSNFARINYSDETDNNFKLDDSKISKINNIDLIEEQNSDLFYDFTFYISISRLT